MRLFNTLSQQIEPLDIRDQPVSLYVCGITPYDTTHLGHAWINVIYDCLVRYLRWRGATVRYVQNVTDIDDDILRKAREIGTSWDELGTRETEKYLADLRALHVRMPDYYVRASAETPAMISLITELVAKGYAYTRDGWVYYSVRRDPDFGRLADSGGYVGYENWLATANDRGNFPDDPRKLDPLDFVLWQAQQPGEPAWPSPWGPGRPGWHIECSAMSIKYLGEPITIHGGGSDLVFPHHTCEIAQSEHATGRSPFVQIWMHCAMVELDGVKMSKSLGNLILVRDLLAEYSPDAVRILLLRHHYRESWSYTAEDMRASADLADRLACAKHHLVNGTVGGVQTGDYGIPLSSADGENAGHQARLEFVAALEDDFQTPRALEVLRRLAGHICESAPSASVGAGAAQVATLTELAATLGLSLSK
jgi:L-cysteine:1D-myo-inositol 2-amino-2-deoxy-alpha-D-glucopyranoside ligase